MRLFGKFIFFLVLGFSALGFIFFYNFKQTVYGPEKAKQFLNKANFYQPVSATIRQNIIEASGQAELKNGKLFEILDQYISPQSLKTLTEDAVDQFFVAVKKPEGERKVVLKLSSYKDQLVSQLGPYGVDPNILPKDTTVIDLNNNALAKFLANLDKVILIYGIVAIVSFLLLFLLGGLKSGLYWVGTSFLFIAIPLGTAIGLMGMYLPKLEEQTNANLNFQDAKFGAATNKLLDALSVELSRYLTYEAIGLAAIGVLAIIIGKSIYKADKNPIIIGDKSTPPEPKPEEKPQEEKKIPTERNKVITK